MVVTVGQIKTKLQTKKELANRRKMTMFLSLELWMLLLMCLVIQLHGQRSESWGANTASVQLFIGNGDASLVQIRENLAIKMRGIRSGNHPSS